VEAVQEKQPFLKFSPLKSRPTTLCAIRRSIGYIPQNIRLFPDLSVFDNVLLSLSLVGPRSASEEAAQKVHDLLGRLDLSSKTNQNASSLSGGEAQRVAIARALVRTPELLVADEPTGAQDRDSTWTILDLFLKANRSGTTVVLATHDPEMNRRVRKRCAFLKEGRLNLESVRCIY
jgi:ABC-type ATPase involved in cell division